MSQGRRHHVYDSSRTLGRRGMSVALLQRVASSDVVARHMEPRTAAQHRYERIPRRQHQLFSPTPPQSHNLPHVYKRQNHSVRRVCRGQVCHTKGRMHSRCQSLMETRRSRRRVLSEKPELCHGRFVGRYRPTRWVSKGKELFANDPVGGYVEPPGLQPDTEVRGGLSGCPSPSLWARTTPARV